MVYQWKAGAKISAKAELVGDEVAGLGDEVTPSGLVEAGRDKETELHKCFEWDNEEAAHEYRLEQDRLVLRSLVIVSDGPGEGSAQQVTLAYHSVEVGDTDDPRRAYVPLAMVAENPDYRAQVVSRMRSAIDQAIGIATAFEDALLDFEEVKGHLSAAREAVHV